jgi:hypothetical protein
LDGKFKEGVGAVRRDIRLARSLYDTNLNALGMRDGSSSETTACREGEKLGFHGRTSI